MAPLDIHPSRLRVTFGGPALPAVATRRVTVAGTVVEAAILSASHAIRTADGQALETLACGTGGEHPADTDAMIATPTDVWHLAFRYSESPIDARHLTRLVTRLRMFAFVHTFPGHPDAVTAIAARDRGWSTWHCYPEYGRVARSVTTATRVPVPAPPEVRR